MASKYGMHGNLTHKIFFTFILLMFQILAISQDPCFYSFNDKSGFTVNEVYEISQDSRRNIWIASLNGLYRFDGNSIMAINSKEHVSGSLSILLEDSLGRIWTRNFRGQIFHTDGDVLKLAFNWEDSIGRFPSMTMDLLQNIWISGDKGIYRYSIKNNAWTKITLDPIKYPNIAFDYNSVELIAGPDNRIWFSNNAGNVGHIKDEIIHLNEFKDKNMPLIFFDKLFEFEGNIYGWSNNSHIYKLNDEFTVIADLTELGVQRLGMLDINAINSNTLAISTIKGVYFLDKNFRLLSNKPIYKGIKISGLYQDCEKSLWVSTLQNGVRVIPNIEIGVYNKHNSALPENDIFCFARNEQNIYAGFNSGIVGYFNQKTSFTTIFTPNHTFEVSCINTTNTSNHVVWLQSQKWFQSNQSNAITSTPFAISAPKEIRFYSDLVTIPANNGVQIFMMSAKGAKQSIISEGNNMTKGEMTFPLLGNKNTEIFVFRKNKKARTAVFEQKSKTLWGGFNDGVYFWRNNHTSELLINGNRIYCNKLTQSDNGMIWLAASTGVYGVQDTTIVYFYPTTSSVRTIYADTDTLWFASTDALYRLTWNTKKVEAFGNTDGISTFEIHDLITDEQHIYMATPEGIIYMPKKIELNNQIPPLINITQVKFLERDTILANEYELPYYKNHLAIGFTGYSIKSRGTYTVTYRMLGLSNLWISIPGNTHIIRFPSLIPGKYTFEIKCVNEDGIESISTETIHFTILKPYWQTFWFRALVILILGYIVFLLFRQRIRVLSRKNQLEKQLKISEITAIKAQMNPHFIFNSLNSIQDLILRKDLRSSNMYLGKFSDLLRLILEVSGKENINLETEIEILTIYLELEKLRFEEFNFKIDSSDLTLPPTAINLPSMIIQPFVENAVKHGLLHKYGQKNLSIRFSCNQQLLTCVIEDDGIGRVRAEEIKQRRNKLYQPFGNSASQKRIELINALGEQHIFLQIEDLYEDNIAKGTRVVLSFSIHL